MNDDTRNAANFDGDLSEYLQTFLDETEEQLDDLVETMLSIEDLATNAEALNEAFRLIHSIKGSAGMMGLDQISVLTHHLEDRFERFRSGTEILDEPTMNLVLRCIDFLRQCNDGLRKGESLRSPTELLVELNRLENQSASSEAIQQSNPMPDIVEQTSSEVTSRADVARPSERLAGNASSASLPSQPRENSSAEAMVRIVVRFRTGLQLTDLKAQLIVNRLVSLGDVRSTQPDLKALPEDEQLEVFEVRMETDADTDRLRMAADVDGVEAIDVLDNSEIPTTAMESNFPETGIPQPPVTAKDLAEVAKKSMPPAEASEVQIPAESIQRSAASPAESPGSGKVPTKVVETMRVDIDRLDGLMNLAGELVVNRARFVQISSQISAAHRKASTLNRIREFCDNLRGILRDMQDETAPLVDRKSMATQLSTGLQAMEEHTEDWEHDRHHLENFGEAIDQLSRVSHSLQKGVLDTRIVPVAPLFSRFKRVIRDLSKDCGKRVNLEIRGEKTELDKRMIDEMGDPLVHLVRNSIDHGLESPNVRIAHGKPEAGTIILEATHSGNNVYIHVRDDGAGIDTKRIKEKLISNRVLTEVAAGELDDNQALEFIWHPGFTTATEVTDVSGRGVGMDAVRNRIRQLNGSIEVESFPDRGTHFTIRLPLTLAIINCLLVKMRGTVFSIPIDQVREIVSIQRQDVITVRGTQTIEVRGEITSLVSIHDLFVWHGIDYGRDENDRRDVDDDEVVDVVILQSAGRTMGVRVNELLGSQDLVIKSLSDNFVHLRGLSGASILGDGSVCLLLDVGNVFQLATQSPKLRDNEELIA